MRISVLGPAGPVAPDGSVAPLPSRRQRQVLAALALTPDRPMTVERIADLLWEDDLPRDPAATVHTIVSRLRRTLAASGVEIDRSSLGYRLAVAPDEVDGHAVTAGSPTDRGRPWDDLDHPDVAAARATAEAARWRALLAEGEVALAAGDTDRALALADALAAEAPGREEPVALRLRSLTAAGRRSDAATAFAVHRATVVEATGLEPSAALRALADAALRDDDPPAPSAPPPGGLIGRAADLDGVRGRLSAGAVVTVVGPGGAGKTRLAREVVGADGRTAWWVDLSALPRDAEVEAAVGQGVHLPSGDGPWAERMAAHVDGGLLVLDTCEHVAGPVGDLVDALTRRAPRLAVLATSREPLGVDGEQRWPVAGLDPADAAALFALRVGAVAPDVELDPTDVAALCARVDHLPLGIELTAAAVPGRGVPAVRAGIDEPLALDAVANRRRPARHRDLGALVRWSVDLLGDDERAVLLALGVFAGPFTPNDAEAVVGPAATACVPLLVERSLVARVGDGRLRLLDTVRAVARADIDPSAAAAAAEAHRRWALALAAGSDAAFRGADGGRHAAAVHASLADLRQAHDALLAAGDDTGRARLCADLCWWAWSAMVEEVQGWMDAAADLSPADPDLAASLRAAVCVVRARPTEPAPGRAAAAAALAAADVTGVAPATAAHVHLVVSDIRLYAGEFADAVAHAEVARGLALDGGDLGLAALASVQCAIGSSYLGLEADADRWADVGEADAEASGSRQLRAWACYGRGEVLADRDPVAALAHLDACLALIDPGWDRFLAGVCRLTRASVRGRSRATPEVFADYADLLDGWHRAGLWAQAMTAARTLVELLVDAGDAEEAAVVLAGVERHAEPARGADADRVAAARARLVTALTPEALAQATARGADLDRDGLATCATAAARARS